MEEPIDVLMEKINEELKRIMPAWLEAVQEVNGKKLMEIEGGRGS